MSKIKFFNSKQLEHLTLRMKSPLFGIPIKNQEGAFENCFLGLLITFEFKNLHFKKDLKE